MKTNFSATNPSFLRLFNVSKQFIAKSGTKDILSDVNLSVNRGEFIALVGPSGSGKSTLLKLILGEEEPTSGRITLENQVLKGPDVRRGIVHQNYSLFPFLTVKENIIFGNRFGGRLFVKKSAPKQIWEAAEILLEKADLINHRDKYPFQLSGGQRQRAAVMQALAIRPGILLMDEPFGALDPGTRERMQVFLAELWEKERITIVLVTHDLEEAVFVAPRIVGLGEKNDAKGATIIFDKQLRKNALALSVQAKKDPRFTEAIEFVREAIFGIESGGVKHGFSAANLEKFEISDEI